jgi:hypothetical protein
VAQADSGYFGAAKQIEGQLADVSELNQVPLQALLFNSGASNRAPLSVSASPCAPRQILMRAVVEGAGS